MECKYLFKDCEFNVNIFCLKRSWNDIRLYNKVREACLYLLKNCRHIISKEESVDQIWPGQFISESTLVSTIRDLRKAIGDDDRTQRMIQVIHGLGYHFVAPVEEFNTTSSCFESIHHIHQAFQTLLPLSDFTLQSNYLPI